jgi:hypothetical protein
VEHCTAEQYCTAEQHGTAEQYCTAEQHGTAEQYCRAEQHGTAEQYCTAEQHGTAEQTTDDNIIRRMRITCWVTRATDAHLGCVIRTAFLRQ